MKKRNYLIVILFLIVVLMGIGYSAFATKLNISGTSTIASNWNVYISNVKVKAAKGGAKEKEVPSWNKLSASVSASLTSPGDYIIYTITVTNDGDIDAYVKDVNISSPENDAISFETSGLDKDSPLLKGSSDTMDLLIKYNDVSSQPSNLSATIKVDLTFEQKVSDSSSTNMKYVKGTASNVLKLAGSPKKDCSANDINDLNLVYDCNSDSSLRFVGENPNNYVNFNNELWRIIGVARNVDDGTGKKEARFKIIRNTSLGEYSWDTSEQNVNFGNGINEWSQADLMQELNTDYLGNITIGTDGYWYGGLNNNNYDYLMPSASISADSQNLIDNAVWYLGRNKDDSKYSSDISPLEIYADERSANTSRLCSSGSNQCNDTVERKTSWTGKVGLIYPSDFYFATGGTSKLTRESCIQEWGWGSTCSSNDWMAFGTKYWTISPRADSITGSTRVYDVFKEGNSMFMFSSRASDNDKAVFPVVYLKASVEIISGDGSIENPFELM